MTGWQTIGTAALGAAMAAAAQAGPCDGAPYRAFDFWLGEWEVRTPDGKLAGSNRIERVHGGCAIRERYTTPRGYAGESLNAWDAGRRVWHQTWVDNAGTLLLLEGGRVGDGMVLEGRTAGTDGTTTRHRITWTPQPDAGVRQLWEQAQGDGPWTTAFDGRYTRPR